MISIRVFDKSLNLVTEIDNYEDAYYTRSWLDAGDFQITINRNKLDAFGYRYTDSLKRGYFIAWNKDPNKLGIITDIEKKVDESGKISEEFLVSGREALTLLKRRRVQPAAGNAYVTLNAPVETVLKTLVSGQAGPTVVDTKRKFSLLDIQADAAGGTTYLLNARWTNLLDEVKAAILATGLSCDIVLNQATHRLTLVTNVGTNRTASQSLNGRALFTTDYETLKSASFKESELNYLSLAYVGGTGTGAGRTIRTVYQGPNEPTDLDRFETFVDARDLSANADLDARGLNVLLANQYTMYVDGAILPYGNLIYQTHWDLGDIATTTYAGVSNDARITAVREHSAPLTYELDVTFDRSFPELPSSVAAQLAAYGAVNNATA